MRIIYTYTYIPRLHALGPSAHPHTTDGREGMGPCNGCCFGAHVVTAVHNHEGATVPRARRSQSGWHAAVTWAARSVLDVRSCAQAMVYLTYTQPHHQTKYTAYQHGLAVDT
jgi:hypothetical protein